MMEDIIISDCLGFEWDEFNSIKNWEKHGVSNLECEEVFSNRPIAASEDSEHSQFERRMHVLGKTNNDRKLFIVFRYKKLPYTNYISTRYKQKRASNL